MHLHKWGEWVDHEAEWSDLFGRYTSVVQVRRCTRCNKMKWRYV